MPFGQYLIAADLDIGILFVIAVTSLVTIGLMTGGWASNNKWSLLGGIRSAAQIISYEIPGAVAIVCLVMMTGSLRMQDIIARRAARSIGGWPWYWFVFRNPITFVLFFLYFTTALAEGNRAPFDLARGRERARRRLLHGVLGHAVPVLLLRRVGERLRDVRHRQRAVPRRLADPGRRAGAAGGALRAPAASGAFIFLLKSWVLIFVVIWIRWTLPRVRIDQMMNLCWKWFVPLSFGAFMLTAGWMVVGPSNARSSCSSAS